MTITVPENGEIDIEVFKNLLDISKIEWYNLEDKGGYLAITFYDSKRKAIPLYANKKTKKARSKKKQAKS
jgi:hypothetical protein